MKTRTLLLLALACGMAIMLAGAVFLVQLSGQDDVSAPIQLGAATTVGDMQVTVERSFERNGVLDVSVRIGGVADSDGLGGFRLIASGRGVRPTGSPAAGTCVATTVAEQGCVVRFDVSGADGTSRVLFYERGDDQARWVLG